MTNTDFNWYQRYMGWHWHYYSNGIRELHDMNCQVIDEYMGLYKG
jgi:hypothetical protein